MNTDQIWSSRIILGIIYTVILNPFFVIYFEAQQGNKFSFQNLGISLSISILLIVLIQIKTMLHLKRYITSIQFEVFFKKRSQPLKRYVILLTIYLFAIISGIYLFPGAFSRRITLYLSLQKPNDSQTRCIPWNYARFLSYAADRKLLQQTGGAYRFIHRSLLEHFAKMGETGSP